MIRLHFFSILIFIFSTQIYSQQDHENQNSYFQSPLDIPLYLSGNFGELRSTHFHAGIDIKTQATEGHNVYAAAGGYISRIKIQTGGYGRSLYIAHQNGLTTVYAHLQIYAPDIEKFIKDYQYRNKTHTLDLYLKPGQIPVEKGEIIALSGNSGSSGGPHLHFEIREAASQNPRNGLLYNFDIKDNIPPQIRGISVYPLDNKSFVDQKQNRAVINAIGSKGEYVLSKNPVTVYGQIGFGIETYDYLNGSQNRCGIYSIEMKIDSVPVYYYEMSSFSFSETGYIHSHVDYGEWKRSGRRFQKINKDPNNNLSLYHMTLDDSGYPFLENGTHNIEFTVKDSYQNTSLLKFKMNVKPNTILAESNRTKESRKDIVFSQDATNYFEKEDINIKIPYKGLFSDMDFEYSKSANFYSPYSDLHHVHNIYTPLYKRYELKIKPTKLPRNLWNKATLIRLDKDNDKDVISSKFENGFVIGEPNKFGRFYIDVDTLAPKITPLNVYSSANLSKNEYVSFGVSDNLTGVASYNGYIDNRWVLFEYDPKFSLIRYYFDTERLERGKNHELELIVTDEKNNESSYSVEFYW